MNILKLLEKKQNNEKITMLTAYDYPLANLVDKVGVDIMLVGDSLGTVIKGDKDTLGVTLDEIIYHTKLVAKAVKNSFLVADMPFLSAQVSPEKALENAGRIMQEGGAYAVKIEGGGEVLSAIKKIIATGIPVMGHLGFTPQSLYQLGGYKIQGKENEARKKILEEALLLQEAGIFALVLEMVPESLGKEVSDKLKIPVISCGAGAFCDGQVLVTYDILGLSDRSPKFAKKYVDLKDIITQAIETYIKEVGSGEFPSKEHSFE